MPISRRSSADRPEALSQASRAKAIRTVDEEGQQHALAPVERRFVGAPHFLPRQHPGGGQARQHLFRHLAHFARVGHGQGRSV
jgi:hypothetical protein